MASLFQFSIRGLLIAVTIAAVGIAALLNANAWWEAAVWGASLFVLACAVGLIIYRRDDRRAFWIGFGIFGWLYLFVLVYSWTPYANPQYFRSDPMAQSSLITTRLSHLAYSSILPDSKTQQEISAGAAGFTPTYYGTTTGGVATTTAPASQPMPVIGSVPIGGSGSPPGPSFSGMGFMGSGMPMIPNPSYVPIDNFTHIAHALWLLLIAAIGGKACQFIYRTRPKETQP